MCILNHILSWLFNNSLFDFKNFLTPPPQNWDWSKTRTLIDILLKDSASGIRFLFDYMFYMGFSNLPPSNTTYVNCFISRGARPPGFSCKSAYALTKAWRNLLSWSIFRSRYSVGLTKLLKLVFLLPLLIRSLNVCRYTCHFKSQRKFDPSYWRHKICLRWQFSKSHFC